MTRNETLAERAKSIAAQLRNAPEIGGFASDELHAQLDNFEESLNNLYPDNLCGGYGLYMAGGGGYEDSSRCPGCFACGGPR